MHLWSSLLSSARAHGETRPEVQHALFLVWHAANRICAKRLFPFLPDFSKPWRSMDMSNGAAEHRSQLLSMSAATADRLLQAHRYTHPHGLSTTKAGPLRLM